MATKIEWAEETWNPITGCTPVSEGCANCYAKRMAQRLRGRYGYPVDDPFRVTMHGDRLHEPGALRKPSMIFVSSMGDIFHDDVEWEWLFQIFQIAGMIKRHKFIFLTKRPERAKEELNGDLGFHLQRQDWCKSWPLPNVWFGVTVENDKHLDRIETLCKIPAAVRFLSVEPMLGPVSAKYWYSTHNWHNWLTGETGLGRTTDNFKSNWQTGSRIDWVICGGETGPGARPMHPDWVRSLRDQCVSAGVPFFFKSWGDYEYQDHHSDCKIRFGGQCDCDGGTDDLFPVRVGKKAAGRLLDGREWNEYPKGADHGNSERVG